VELHQQRICYIRICRPRSAVSAGMASYFLWVRAAVDNSLFATTRVTLQVIVLRTLSVMPPSARWELIVVVDGSAWHQVMVLARAGHESGV